MGTIGIAPFVLKDVLFTVDADDYQAGCSQVQFDPASSTSTWQGLTPTATFTDASTATWTCTVAYAQDWETPDSLAQYLHAHEGESVDVVFKPKSGSGPSFEATVIIAPGTIGGTVNQWTVATVTLGVSGKPTLVPTAP